MYLSELLLESSTLWVCVYICGVVAGVLHAQGLCVYMVLVAYLGAYDVNCDCV